jgi:hypothetical protein
MGFLNWFKSLFSEKKEEETLEKKREPVDYEVVRLLESYTIEPEILSLEQIYNTAESIQNYIYNLNKDIETIKKQEKIGVKYLESSISKIKRIVENTLELENQIKQLIEHYHNPILNILKKVNEIKNDDRIENQINKIKENKQKLEELCNLLKSFIIFEGIFENTSDNMEEIEQNFKSKVLSEDINGKFKDLKKELNSVIIGQTGLKESINYNILKDIEKLLFED